MEIRKLGISVEEQAQQELSASRSAKTEAITDYNIMMDYLEDPTAEEDEEDE